MIRPALRTVASYSTVGLLTLIPRFWILLRHQLSTCNIQYLYIGLLLIPFVLCNIWSPLLFPISTEISFQYWTQLLCLRTLGACTMYSTYLTHLSILTYTTVHHLAGLIPIILYISSHHHLHLCVVSIRFTHSCMCSSLWPSVYFISAPTGSKPMLCTNTQSEDD